MAELKPIIFWRTAVAAAIGQRRRLAAGLALGGMILVDQFPLSQRSYFASAMKPGEYRAVMADEVSPGELLGRLLLNHPDVAALGPEDGPAVRELLFGVVQLGILAAPGNGSVMGGVMEEYHV